jgi:hypothetical protein
MNREDLEHIIRAAGGILGEDAVVIVGSQAILATYPAIQLPPDAIRSVEADVMPIDDVDGRKADTIAFNLGEFSSFDELHGIHADGVGRETSILPHGWEDRLIEYKNENTDGVTGFCLEKYDLCIAKLAAFRPKDTQFVRALTHEGLLDVGILYQRLEETTLEPELRARIVGFLQRLS